MTVVNYTSVEQEKPYSGTECEIKNFKSFHSSTQCEKVVSFLIYVPYTFQQRMSSRSCRTISNRQLNVYWIRYSVQETECNDAILDNYLETKVSQAIH